MQLSTARGDLRFSDASSAGMEKVRMVREVRSSACISKQYFQCDNQKVSAPWRIVTVRIPERMRPERPQKSAG